MFQYVGCVLGSGKLGSGFRGSDNRTKLVPKVILRVFPDILEFSSRKVDRRFSLGNYVPDCQRRSVRIQPVGPSGNPHSQSVPVDDLVLILFLKNRSTLFFHGALFGVGGMSGDT